MLFRSLFFVFLSYFTPEPISCLFKILQGSAGTGILIDADGFVGEILGVLQNLSGLLVGIPQNAVFVFVYFFILCLKLFLQGFDFLFVGDNLQTLVLNGYPAVFKVGEQVFKALVRGGNLPSGGFNDIIRKP